MQVLFVHGMGRSSLSWLPTLARFRADGFAVQTFSYNVIREDFSQIVRRLVKSLALLAQRGDYILVGHSLGGVLLRAALAECPANMRKPMVLFLLGSPILPSRLARRLRKFRLFRGITRDSGQLLGSARRMRDIPVPAVRTVAILGTRGVHGRWSPFGQEDNDGIVSVAEASAAWLDETLRVPVVHTLLPSSREVAALMLARIGRRGK
jgi:pimeloyl-ACP methyl ester carboxylesterase